MITTVRGQSKEEKKDDKERQLDEQLPHVVVQAHHIVFTTKSEKFIHHKQKNLPLFSWFKYGKYTKDYLRNQ